MAVNGIRLVACSLAVCCVSCGKEPVVGRHRHRLPPPATAPPSAPTPNVAVIARDAELFVLVTQTEPFAPVPSRSGCRGSHDRHAQRLERASAACSQEHDATVVSALQDGRLPTGAMCRNGSVVFKDVPTSGGTTVTGGHVQKL
jgi:hypothetical protein